MKPIALSLLALTLAAPSRAELPEMYRRVASVHWVVKDLGPVKAGWAKLGYPALQDMGEMTVAGSFRGQSGSSRFRIAQSRIAGAEVVWIQPVEGESAFSEHLARRGEGVVSINYAAPSLEALEAEVKRLGSLGVSVLQRAEVPTAAGRLTVVHMDTATEGKYVLGLVHGEAPRPTVEAPAIPFPAKLSQYALVVKSLDDVSAYWQKLGFPAMDVTHGPLTDLVYRGQPGRLRPEARLAPARDGHLGVDRAAGRADRLRGLPEGARRGLPPLRPRRAGHGRRERGLGGPGREDRPGRGVGGEGEARLGAVRLRRDRRVRGRHDRVPLEPPVGGDRGDGARAWRGSFASGWRPSRRC